MKKKTGTCQKLFSISKEYTEVHRILDAATNKSRFICEAIIEKYNREENEKSHRNKLKEEILRTTILNQLQLDTSGIKTSTKERDLENMLKYVAEMLFSHNKD